MKKISNSEFPAFAKASAFVKTSADKSAGRQISNSTRGFTLIELLVVIAIIGVLASVVLVSMTSARIKSRDARRLADMQQIKSGLDIYYNIGSGYPDTAAWLSAQTAFGQLSCLDTPAFKVPQDVLNATTPGFAYTYTAGGNSTPGCDGTVFSTYEIGFQTEGETSIGPAGTYFLSPLGFTATAPF